ncbi:MAG: hypothetical protein C4554_07680 [Dethiobacter sp.]|nr:MAG: hypothetical protein C4554_07680 [Dethiobacter sp.]
MSEHNPTPKIATLIKATPYRHKAEAFNFISELFGFIRGGDENISINSQIAAVQRYLQQGAPAGKSEGDEKPCD